jgi:hypothetical protein
VFEACFLTKSEAKRPLILGAGLRFSEAYKCTVRKIEGPRNNVDGVFLREREKIRSRTSAAGTINKKTPQEGSFC